MGVREEVGEAVEVVLETGPRPGASRAARLGIREDLGEEEVLEVLVVAVRGAEVPRPEEAGGPTERPGPRAELMLVVVVRAMPTGEGEGRPVEPKSSEPLRTMGAEEGADERL